MNVARVCGLFVIAALAGCGSESSPLPEGAPPLYEVSGKVTHNDAPLSDAVLVFAPKDGRVGASARTDSEGKFVAQAFPPHNGMAEGDYMVSITKTETFEVNSGDPDNKATATKHLIPQKYSQPTTSGLTLTVKPETNSDVAFELKD